MVDKLEDPEIRKLRQEVADLEAKHRGEHRESYQRLREARNHLAYMTAEAYVNVYEHPSGKLEGIFGVSREVKKTRCVGFALSLDKTGRRIQIEIPVLSGERVLFQLEFGHNVRITVFDANGDVRGRIMHFYTFRSYNAAKEFHPDLSD